MAQTIDELSIDYSEDGVLLSKQLDKVVLSKGAWSTILYKYQDWNRQKEEYGPIKFSIRRYQKRSGEYSQRSRFNISSVDQAKKIIESLEGWIKEAEAEAGNE